MRKPAFCICKNKVQINVQLISTFVFCCIDSTMTLLPSTSSMQNFKPIAIFCGCTVKFVLDLVRNPYNDCSPIFGVNKALFFLILGLRIFFQNIKVGGGKKIKIKITKIIFLFNLKHIWTGEKI